MQSYSASQAYFRLLRNGDELLEVVNRVKIDALHLVEMRLEIQRLVVAEPHGTEKTGQIFLLVGRRIESNADGADHS